MIPRIADTVAVLGMLAVAPGRAQEPVAAAEQEVVVPRLWAEAALADWATPLAGLGLAPGLYDEEEYDSAPVDNLRTYPLYHPRFEPEGYRDALLARGPQPLIVPGDLHSEADWVAAGQRVFEELDTAITRTASPVVLEYFTDAAALDAGGGGRQDARTRDGVLLDYRWVVDLDGRLKVSLASCSSCHSRLMPDGTLLRGAPANYDLADTPAAAVLLAALDVDPQSSHAERFFQLHGVPWREDDPHARIRGLSDAEFDERFGGDDGAPPGTVFARFNGSPLFTTRMADLRGIRDRRWLDSTAGFKNRGPEDVARYGIMVEFAEAGVFGPYRMQGEANARLPVRPPDAAMYALGLYLYSLDPAPSPHPFSESARRGEELFGQEGCATCHTPPIYTNNEVVAVRGFTPPADAAEHGLVVATRRVGTDPGLALFTRKGTGYYKVPSLRGLWYRGLYEHSGSLASLEDWFDPRRLQDDYRPTGWRGPGVETRAVPGHEFGLDLEPAEKADLIAFLLTL